MFEKNKFFFFSFLFRCFSKTTSMMPSTADICMASGLRTSRTVGVTRTIFRERILMQRHRSTTGRRSPAPTSFHPVDTHCVTSRLLSISPTSQAWPAHVQNISHMTVHVSGIISYNHKQTNYSNCCHQMYTLQ